MAPKALTPADLRRPGVWGRPVRIYPTIQARPALKTAPPSKLKAPVRAA